MTALESSAERPVAAVTPRQVLASLGQRRSFAWGVVWATLTALCGIGLMASAAWLLAQAWTMPPILHLQMVIVGVRGFALAKAAGRYLERLVSHDAALTMVGAARGAVFDRIRPVMPGGTRAQGESGLRSGELLGRLVDDVDRLQDWPLRVRQPLIVSLVSAGVATAVVAWIAPLAGLVLAVALVAALIVGVGLSTRLAARAETEIAPLSSQLQTAIIDHARALPLLRAYDAEPASRAAILGIDARLQSVERRMALASGAVAGVSTMLAGIAVAGVVLVTAPATADGGLSGSLAALCALVPLAVFEVWAAIPLAVVERRRVLASAARVADVAQSAEGIPAEVGTTAAPVGVLSLRGVTAGWPGQPPAFEPVDLDARPGETVAIVGASGAGKSTLAAALVRFIDHQGDYRVGGVDVRGVHPEAVRESVVIVEQRAHVFDEDLRQNLLFARDDASDDDLSAVLERVGLGDWARDREGLDTRMGERGELVSGGQAQRIGLARALLADPPILVLDEPTANVDAEVADALMRDVLEAARGGDRIVLAISHAQLPADLVTRTVRIHAAG